VRERAPCERPSPPSPLLTSGGAGALPSQRDHPFARHSQWQNGRICSVGRRRQRFRLSLADRSQRQGHSSMHARSSSQCPKLGSTFSQLEHLTLTRGQLQRRTLGYMPHHPAYRALAAPRPRSSRAPVDPRRNPAKSRQGRHGWGREAGTKDGGQERSGSKAGRGKSLKQETPAPRSQPGKIPGGAGGQGCGTYSISYPPASPGQARNGSLKVNLVPLTMQAISLCALALQPPSAHPTADLLPLPPRPQTSGRPPSSLVR
jgi:hypothetical protein